MLLLAIGDIVGKPGRRLVAEFVPRLRALRVDFVVANAENAAGGSGLTPAVLAELFASGVDVITSGDHAFKNSDVLAVIDSESRLLRPLNLSSLVPGRGYTRVTVKGRDVVIINLIGRVFMPPAECPFLAVNRVLDNAVPDGALVIVDMHAEATSEKIAMGRHLDGRTALVFGTHTHVQTADEDILPGGTAYITDLGMTGPFESVIGREIPPVITGFLTGMPCKFDVAKGDPRLSGLLVRIDNDGTALAVKRLQLRAGAEVMEGDLV